MHAVEQLIRTIRIAHHRAFSVHEIETSRTLQWFFGGILFYFFITFESWVMGSRLTIENAANAICWPHYQDCGWLYFLSNLPNGYSQTTFYMMLYAVMLLIVYCMWRRKWVEAHALMLLLFVWKAFVGYLLSYGIMGMYDDYHMVLAAALLFLPHKEYFAKLLFIVLYFVAATIKFHPSWVLGTYFSSLQNGLPIFPDSLIPVFTNFVIFEQIIGCWFLLSKRVIVQRAAFVLFVIFHLYSGVFVLFNYPSATLPALLILFGPLYRYQRPPIDWRSIAGWTLVAALFVAQIPSWKGDADAIRITVANNRYGLWMFDSNHQCVTTIKYHFEPGVKISTRNWEAAPGTPCAGFECVVGEKTYKEKDSWVREVRRESAVSWKRCDPYEKWRAQKNRCDEYASISMKLDHSINGSPFYRIIDEENICNLEYNLFDENPWIQAPPKAPAVGIPVKNVYRYMGQTSSSQE